MMTTRLVYRLLDPHGELLGWTEDMAEARGDGALRASRPIAVPIELAGVASEVSIHWVDINVETRVPTLFRDVAVGVTVIAFQAGQIVVVVGTSAGGLPPVTVRRDVTIGVPVGAMAALGNP